MRRGCNQWLRLGIVLVVALTIAAIGLVGFAAETEPVQGPVCYNHGDVNSDGTIDSRDAIYTLYHFLLGEEEYPVEQDWDFNADQTLDSRDAIYVLYACMHEDDPDYALEGVVHNYYDPTWSWEGTAATVTFKCGCGQTTVLTQQEGVTVTESERKEATCVDAGAVTYLAEVTIGNQKYSGTKTVTLPAGAGHNMVGTQGCETESQCSYCDHKLPALGHKWVADASLSSAATCTVKAVQGYRCSQCQQTKTVEVEGSAAHKYEYLQDLDKGNCLFVKQYKCSVCQDTIEGTAQSDSYYKHSYTATLTKEATCVSEGQKTYACSVCGDSYTTPVDKNDSHSWNAGVTGTDGVTTYSCTDCSATKTAVTVAADETVDKTALGSAQELQMANDTALSMDEDVVKNLEENRQIKLSVETVDLKDVTLTDDKKAQIGDNTVYDFNMVYADNNDKVEFEGLITVSLPYTLQPGEDIDSIDVWYISDTGELEQVNGTYSNGCVTFTTDHFSYYTVTRLTPAQRCERYGHIPVSSQKQASCTQDGYSMSVCQRCAAELEKQIIKMSGHSYEKTETKATCDKDGAVVQTCSTCGDTVTEVLPALGHELHLDESKHTDASCTAAGKDVYVCARTDCGFTREDAVPQLAHNYQEFENKTATCTEKGYVTNKCLSCGQIETVSETAPLGHAFLAENAVWTWSDDNYSATLTLVCSHDKTHTKTLNAVVTETVESSTCTGDGAVVYTAEASYNNKLFTDTVTVTQAAPGHKPGTAWEKDENQHYHICQSCQEKVDTASHNWNSGTQTKAPTCDKPGEKQVKCTVCGYTKTQTIPATGNHTFVNGVCSVCGYKEGSCEHFITNMTLVDMGSYNVCPGAEIYWIGCDCGQNKRLAIKSISCDMEELEPRYETGSDNEKITVWRYGCTKCQLIAEESYYGNLDKATCTTQQISYTALFWGQTSIEESRYVVYEEQHATNEEISSVDLTAPQYGLCGEKLITDSCACGKRTYTYVDEMCNWVHESDGDGYYCDSCGAEKHHTTTTQKGEGPCQVIDTTTYTYLVDGKEVYSYTNVNEYEEHAYKVTDHTLKGETCEDGVIIERTCQVCGDYIKELETYHTSVTETRTDLTGYDICAAALYQGTCGCPEAYTECYLEYDGDTYCQWYGMGMDEDSGTEIRYCDNCEAVMKSVTTYGEKDAECFCRYETAIRYTDKNGNLIATGVRSGTETRHNMVTSGELLGETCEDGVKITRSCTDCGYSHSYTNTYHETLLQQSYDLSAFNMCCTKAEVYGCPCGRNTYLSWSGEGCQWEYTAGDEGFSEQRCTVCGITRQERWVSEPSGKPCQNKVSNAITLLRGEEELLTIRYNEIEQNHAIIWQLTLVEGATSCEQGYTRVQYCQNCDYVDDGWGVQYDHRNYALSREPVEEGLLCGNAYIQTSGCACGLQRSQSLQWEDGESCNFHGGRYDEALGGWVYTCDGCGTSMTERSEQTPVEGTTCQVQNTWYYTYLKDGQELFTFYETNIWSNHNYVYSFRLVGQTCQDGYYMSRTCSACGYSYEDDSLYSGGCETRPVERETLHDGTGICGPIQLIHQSCACGSRESYSVSLSCQMRDVGFDSQLKEPVVECVNCDLRRAGGWLSQRIPGTCQVNETMKHYYIQDGQILFQVEKSWTEQEHVYVHTYNMQGDSCEDGYTVSYKCAFCDASGSDSGVYYDHQTYRTAYYDLAQYGLCEGSVERYSCACGKESHDQNDGGCRWMHVEYDETLGMDAYHCEDCGSDWYYGETGAINKDTCTFEGTVRYLWTLEGETVLEARIPVAYESHSYQVTGVEFDVPGGDCEDGVTVLRQCEYCGESNNWWNNEHSSFEIKRIELKELGACGGWIVLDSCACGKYAYMNRDWNCNMTSEDDYQGDQAEGSNWTRYTCQECGLQVLQESSWSIPEGSCYGERKHTVTVTLGDKEETFNYTSQQEDHDEQYVYVLEDGKISCEEGVGVYVSCSRCDYSNDWNTYGHSTYVVETIDLAAYGSVCGASLEHWTCACGYVNDYRLGEDTECDIYAKGTEVWIDGAVNDGQYTTEGWTNLNSYAYSEYCAVTDPACGLKLRRAEYWLVEDCMATRYQTWQLGYDEATGTCQREITVATGEKRAFHNYETTAINEAGNEGIAVQGTLYTCTDCGSTFTEKHYYDTLTNHTVKREAIGTNTLDNGERKSYTDITEYIRVQGVDDYSYTTSTRSYTAYTYADGTSYWYEYLYAYDFENGCSCTETYTNSYGENRTNTYTDHRTSRHYETVKVSTCTQYGVQNWEDRCNICGTVEETGVYYTDPTAHDWTWDSERQIYVCWYCDLENSNGASGSIVMEDLTEDYGNGTDYVVGYWNRGEVEFSSYISVITDSADEELVLTGIDFVYLDAKTDNITAVKFSMAQAQQAAQAKLAAEGYTGSYAIRISFVPANSTDTLDYAITFDSLTAE